MSANNRGNDFYVKDMLTTAARINAWARGVIGNRQDLHAEWDSIFFHIWTDNGKRARVWASHHAHDRRRVLPDHNGRWRRWLSGS